MRFKKIIDLFKQRNVCVDGLRGRGKDLLFGNVINRLKKPYISNLCYDKKGLYNQFNINDFDIKNNYRNFNNYDINKYEFPFEDSMDLYLSDCNLYFPNYDFINLNKEYKGFIGYCALSRQISNNNVHFNTQNLNRVWDKLREQSDVYIKCVACFYIPFIKLVIQKVIIYNKEESCINRIRPCRIRVPFNASKEAKMNAQLYKDNFYNVHGDVKSHWLIYFNKSKHDTRAFREILQNGK